jgi:hypothetical protein
MAIRSVLLLVVLCLVSCCALASVAVFADEGAAPQKSSVPDETVGDPDEENDSDEPVLHAKPSTPPNGEVTPKMAKVLDMVGRKEAAGGNLSAAFSDVTTLSSCPSSCPPSWIGDGFCDPECNKAACDYDQFDCCPSSCPDSWPGDHVCDSACMVPQCHYDLGDCFYYFSHYVIVKWAKFSWSAGDNFCFDWFGTELASIHTKTELNQVWRKWRDLLSFRNLWIGLFEVHRSGPNNRNGWAWSDGSHYAQQNFWRGNQPATKGERCALFWGPAQAHGWDDGPCSRKQEIICNA